MFHRLWWNNRNKNENIIKNNVVILATLILNHKQHSDQTIDHKEKMI